MLTVYGQAGLFLLIMADVENQTLPCHSCECIFRWTHWLCVLLPSHSCLQRLHVAFGPIPLHCDILAPAHVCPAPLMVATFL